MVKECPTCKRTYSDASISFCLADGSLLSAPFDPETTQRLPISHPTEQPATEVMHPAPNVGSLLPTQSALELSDIPPTIASSEADSESNNSMLINQQTVESTALTGLTRRKGVKLWFGLGIFCIIAAIYTGSLIPALPALVMFVIALFVGLKRGGYEQL
ncbi:MAG TPA: hypothetical protein VGC91_13070 [Pyrinomonadaceae bacterium]|jgi:hypothetical protein